MRGSLCAPAGWSEDIGLSCCKGRNKCDWKRKRWRGDEKISLCIQLFPVGNLGSRVTSLSRLFKMESSSHSTVTPFWSYSGLQSRQFEGSTSTLQRHHDETTAKQFPWFIILEIQHLAMSYMAPPQGNLPYNSFIHDAIPTLRIAARDLWIHCTSLSRMCSKACLSFQSYSVLVHTSSPNVPRLH